MAVDLSDYTLVIDENFDTDLNTYDGTSGLWTTAPRRENLATNSPRAVFLSESTATTDGEGVGINPLSVDNGILTIGAGVIGDEHRDQVLDALTLAGQEQRADKLEYYAGMISTADTWSQTFGYFEIRAEIPEGKGHWPAFWLAPAGEGWPPEIDIFEAYGRGIGHKTGADNEFNVAVFYDERDADGELTQKVDLTNPYDLDADGAEAVPDVRTNKSDTQYVFHERQDVRADFDDDLYEGFWTFAAEWKPDYIAFYFGRDADSMVEVYRTPTPEDVTSPMYMIANEQIGSNWGWHPTEGIDHLTFAEDNTFNVDYIKSYVLNPTAELRATTRGETMVDGDGDARIFDSKGDDTIALGGGLDLIHLSGGADTLFAERGIGNKVIEGFGSDDRIILDGFFFDGTADVLARLTQVGNDVWLANGADPTDPQTIIFRDTSTDMFSADNFVPRWSTTFNVWASNVIDGTRLRDDDADGHVHASGGASQMTDASQYDGAVTMHGSTEGDNYTVYGRNSSIVEAADGGIDTVRTSRSYTLDDNVENLVSTNKGSGTVLTGNSLGNRIEGVEGNTTFVGAGGDDLIILGEGVDRVVHRPDDGHDTVLGFSADDMLDLTAHSFPSWSDLRDRMTARGEDTLIDLGDGQSVVLRGTMMETLGEANFTFTAGVATEPASTFDRNYRPSIAELGDSLDRTDVAPDVPAIEDTAAIDEDIQTNDSAPTVMMTNEGGKTFGTNLDDTIQGGARAEIIYGRDGNDTIYGGGADDRLSGQAGNDTIFGDVGDDRIFGNDGDDRIDGGAGNDRMFGGTGADIFVIGAHENGELDRIMDFDYTAGDRIDLSSFAAAAGVEDGQGICIEQRGTRVSIYLDETDGSVSNAQRGIHVFNASVEDVQSAVIF